MGEVLDIAMPVSGHREGRLMRILVNINITVPLRRGMKLKLDEGEPFWVEFRYEKLPTFRCYCGYLGHEKKSCLKQSRDIQNEVFVDDPYGSWLRVSPSKSSGWRKYGPGGNRWTPTSPEKSVNSKSGNIGDNRGRGAVRISNFEHILGREDFGGADYQEKIGDTGDMGDQAKLHKEISQTAIPANLGNKSGGLLKPRALGPTLENVEAGPLLVDGPPPKTSQQYLAHSFLQPDCPLLQRPTSIRPSSSEPISITSPHENPLITYEPTPIVAQNNTLSMSSTKKLLLNVTSQTTDAVISPKISQTENTCLLFSSQAPIPDQHQQKGSLQASKRRGRPPGSKSKSDIRRKPELKESGIAVLKELSSSTDKSSRVGDK
ncbi:hypothetical protein Vadar_011604 [Vaccinium darrowii]|uniref:Uncharacterized protein n=1 Tax=Vaccinium darrowii TaxID=229202 RepID=A0ACB7WZR7_9ERIC|nr:hypothetical protein Vadar_011604 [Vaccinium darrowii]